MGERAEKAGRTTGPAPALLMIGAGALMGFSMLAVLIGRSEGVGLVALPVTHNLPFAQLDSAALRAFTDGSGDLPLQLRPGLRIAYLQLWPHARPWRLTRTEPMLRSVPEADAVAAILARALEAHAAGAVLPVRVARLPQADENPGRLVAAE